MTSQRSKILNLPCGGTLAASLIRGVRVLSAVDANPLLHCQAFPERVQLIRDEGGRALTEIFYPADPQAFAAEAIELQRNPWEQQP